MALRVSGAKKPPMPVEEEVPVEQPIPEAPMPEEMPMEEAPMPEEMPMEMGIGKVDPMTAGYMGPEAGPFMCGNCIHFMDNGTCEVISAPVEEQGCCNLFTPMEVPMEGEEMPTEEMPMEEPLPEAPVEEEPPAM
jgi:hypothetical protein